MTLQRIIVNYIASRTIGGYYYKTLYPAVDNKMVEDYALFPSSDAQVAELVDALASGASDRKVVEVRVFSWAPTF